MNAERLVRHRFFRVALALMLIGISGWAFLPYVTHRVGVSAFVNSELIRVTAPIPGRLAPTLPRKGDFLTRTTSVTLIEALSPDRRRLLDLERQDALARQSRELAQRQLRDRLQPGNLILLRQAAHPLAERAQENKRPLSHSCAAERDLRCP